MSDFAKFANIYKLGSAVDEFDVIRTEYVVNIGFKSFEIPSVPLDFNMDDSRPNMGKSADIPLEMNSLTFIFHLECNETFAGRGWNTYKLFMKVVDRKEGSDVEGLERRPKYVEVLVLTECPCLLPKESCYDGPYALVEMTSNSSVEIFTHKHNCRVQQVPGIMTVKFTLIDISRASLAPLRILQIMAKSKCVETLAPVIKECEKTPPDITIECKEGNKLLAYKMILKARTPVLRSLFERIPEITSLPVVHSTFVMKVILHFIYTGTLQEDWVKDEHGVIKATKQFQLLDLMDFFEHYLIKACNKNNALRVYSVAAKHSLKHSLNYARMMILKTITYSPQNSLSSLK